MGDEGGPPARVAVGSSQPGVDGAGGFLAVADDDGDGPLGRHHVAAGEDARVPVIRSGPTSMVPPENVTPGTPCRTARSASWPSARTRQSADNSSNSPVGWGNPVSSSRIFYHAAGPAARVLDRDRVAPAGEVVGGRQARRPRAYHQHPLTRRRRCDGRFIGVHAVPARHSPGGPGPLHRFHPSSSPPSPSRKEYSMTDALAPVIPDLPLLRSALSLAERGWHGFLCVPGGKRPALRGSWQDHATTEPARIRAWWSRAAYNIGIACGPSGLVVIDLHVPAHTPVCQTRMRHTVHMRLL
jgi:Bifunctional DNA primase/polymerase, N-terminal